MAYAMYFGETLLPITPSKLKMKIKSRNETLELVSGDEINLLNTPGLTEVSFDLTLPQSTYPFTNEEAQSADYYLELFETYVTEKTPFQWIVSRSKPNGTVLFYTNLKVVMEDYTITEDAENGFDVKVSVELKQYRDITTKTVTIDTDTGTATVEETRAEGESPSASSYTVQSGDTLWNIAKKYLGDGSRYPEIYELNTDILTDPDLIYPGQELTLPAS